MWACVRSVRVCVRARALGRKGDGGPARAALGCEAAAAARAADCVGSAAERAAEAVAVVAAAAAAS